MVLFFRQASASMLDYLMLLERVEDRDRGVRGTSYKHYPTCTYFVIMDLVVDSCTVLIFESLPAIIIVQLSLKLDVNGIVAIDKGIVDILILLYICNPVSCPKLFFNTPHNLTSVDKCPLTIPSFPSLLPSLPLISTLTIIVIF